MGGIFCNHILDLLWIIEAHYMESGDFDMILEKETVSYIIPLKRTLRSDLSNRFNGTDNTELSGFCQKTELDIPSGEYSIKIYAKDHGNVREIITDTGRAIEI